MVLNTGRKEHMNMNNIIRTTNSNLLLNLKQQYSKQRHKLYVSVLETEFLAGILAGLALFLYFQHISIFLMLLTMGFTMCIMGIFIFCVYVYDYTERHMTKLFLKQSTEDFNHIYIDSIHPWIQQDAHGNQTYYLDIYLLRFRVTQSYYETIVNMLQVDNQDHTYQLNTQAFKENWLTQETLKKRHLRKEKKMKYDKTKEVSHYE